MCRVGGLLASTLGTTLHFLSLTKHLLSPTVHLSPWGSWDVGGILQRTSALSSSLYSELGFTKESWHSHCSAHRMVQEQCCHNQLEELHCATGINLASEPDGCTSLHSYNNSLETIFIKVSKAEDHTRPPFSLSTFPCDHSGTLPVSFPW